ncbi:hypothetical protein [Pseudomonas nitroreducens]|uniref:hypothetical protein n=1 Tax=Pseudomonas nitroreducens TaxID=46680 RepID=UPI002658AFD9|nr:hypothetical protein [Pseudomonas nitroreducens]MCP1647253.1 hypothetical protein [Pseudomonas nitroreducens]MCP1685829.1 hypothetical protein [Pseudomonas nitroreducens]
MGKPFTRRQAVVHWLICVLVTLVMPLAPLAVEAFAFKGHISLASLMLAAGIYTITTGIMSRDTMLAAISMVVALIYMGMYGIVLARGDGMTYTSYFSGSTYFSDLIILLALVYSALVKFVYHVIELRPFDDFALRKE